MEINRMEDEKEIDNEDMNEFTYLWKDRERYAEKIKNLVADNSKIRTYISTIYFNIK